MLLATVSIDLRAATAADAPFLFALYASTRESELAAWGWEPAQRDAFLRMQWVAQSHDWAARHPHADHQVVCLQGQPVGRLLVAKNAAAWRVVDIALLPAHQGSGVGTRLLTQVRDEAGKAGVPSDCECYEPTPRAGCTSAWASRWTPSLPRRPPPLTSP